MQKNLFHDLNALSQEAVRRQDQDQNHGSRLHRDLFLAAIWLTNVRHSDLRETSRSLDLNFIQRIISNHSMGISQTGSDVVRLKVRIVLKYRIPIFALRQQAEYHFYRHAHPTDDGFAPKYPGI
jgi:hypothetical protein